MLDKFPNYNMKILIGVINTKVCKEDFLTLKLGMKVYTKLIMIKELEQ
jgi:hypothetical protein